MNHRKLWVRTLDWLVYENDCQLLWFRFSFSMNLYIHDFQDVMIARLLHTEHEVNSWYASFCPNHSDHRLTNVKNHRYLSKYGFYLVTEILKNECFRITIFFNNSACSNWKSSSSKVFGWYLSHQRLIWNKIQRIHLFYFEKKEGKKPRNNICSKQIHPINEPIH